MPSCSPFSSMTRISRARIRSLVRIICFTARLSKAMVFLHGWAWTHWNAGLRSEYITGSMLAIASAVSRT